MPPAAAATAAAATAAASYRPPPAATRLLSDLRRSPRLPPRDLRAAELRGEIRRQFEAHRGQRDQATIKFLLSGGRQQLKQLGEMLGMQL